MVLAFHWLGATFGYDQLPWKGAIRSFSVASAFIVLSPFAFGYLGVAIFFVISGFCIQLSYARSTHAGFQAFYIRRFFRIYPPYLIALLFYAVAFPPTRLGFAKLWDWAQLGSHLLLVHNFDARSFYGINAAFWSIAVEAQLYLLFPMLVALVARLGWKRTLFFIGLVEVSMRTVWGIYVAATGSALPRWFTASPFIYWYSWSIGAYLADQFLHARPLPFSRAPLGLWLALVLVSYFVKPLPVFTFLFVCILTCACIAKFLTKAGGRSRTLPSYLGPLRTIGLWSYSLYLLHQPLVCWGVKLLNQPPVSSQAHYFLVCFSFFLSFLIMVPLSYLYYRFCELPSISLGRRILLRFRGG